MFEIRSSGLLLLSQLLINNAGSDILMSMTVVELAEMPLENVCRYQAMLLRINSYEKLQ